MLWDELGTAAGNRVAFIVHGVLSPLFKLLVVLHRRVDAVTCMFSYRYPTLLRRRIPRPITLIESHLITIGQLGKLVA